jgi:hypothetical protein
MRIPSVPRTIRTTSAFVALAASVTIDRTAEEAVEAQRE